MTMYSGTSGEPGFYVILRDDDPRLKRYPGGEMQDPAGAEAMRLATANPGHKFFVLKTVRVAEPIPPVPQPPPVALRNVNMPFSNSSPLLTPEF